MHDLLPFIVIGLTTGSVYGLAGVGLVLTYKTSGIFNFAHGSVATLSVFVFYFLRTQHHWPWPAAAVAAVFVLGPLMGVLLELMARVLANASNVLKIAATIGLVIIVLAVGDLWYGSVTNSFPPYLPTSTIRVLGVNVGWNQITVILVALVSTAALYYFFRFIRLGVAMRGVVDDPSLIAMTGENPVVVRRWAWIIGATFASLSGVLLAPSLSLNGLILTELVVQAFGAAAIGYFSSLPLTYVGGLVIGILGSLATKYVAQVPSLSGLPPGLPFIVLFLVLIFTPRAVLAARRYVPNIRIAEPYYAPPRIRAGFGIIAVIVLALVPSLVGTKLAVYLLGPGGRDPVHLPRPAGADLGAGLLVPVRLRRGRGGGHGAFRPQLRHPVAAVAAAGRPRRHPDRRHHRHPGDPPIGCLPGVGDPRVRHPA